jgi:hypothetical protein
VQEQLVRLDDDGKLFFSCNDSGNVRRLLLLFSLCKSTCTRSEEKSKSREARTESQRRFVLVVDDITEQVRHRSSEDQMEQGAKCVMHRR